MGEFDYTYAERQRDMNSEHYQKFYIKTPADTVEFTVGDETAEVINVGLQVVDPNGVPVEAVTALECIVCSDAEGTTPAAISDVTVAVGTDGTILETYTANARFKLLTDDEGKADLDFTDAEDAAETGYLAVKLANGNYAVSDALTWGIEYDVTFTIGAEAGEVINVGIQVVNANADPVAAVIPLLCFVCSDALGETVEAIPDVTVAVGTDGEITATRIANVDFTLTTEATGAADLDFTDAGAGAETGYLAIRLPNGTYVVSNALTWTA